MASVPIKDYVDAQLKALEVARKEALSAMEHRLDGMNEFRDTLRDQANKFITREEYSIAPKSLEDDIRILQRSKDFLAGKASQGALNVTLGISIFGIVLSIILHFV